MKKSTLLMVLLAAALGGAVWYFEFKRPKPADDSATESKPLFTFKPEEVTSLKITRGSEMIALERRGNAWHVTQPMDSAADNDAAEGLLSSLGFARVSKTIAVAPGTADPLKSYGIEAQGLALELKLKSGLTHKIHFGAKDFSGNSVYAIADDATKVLLVPVDVPSNAGKPVLEFRDRRIAVFFVEDLVRLRVKNEHGVLVAAKNAEGKWIVAEPATMKGRELEAERILDTLRSTKAEDIFDSPTSAERARLARPAVEVELTAKDGSATKVEFSGGKGDVYVRSSLGPMLFKVARTVLDAVNFKAADVVKKEEPKVEESPKEAPPTKQKEEKRK